MSYDADQPDFTLPPGGEVWSGMGLASPPKIGKTFRITDTLDAHIKGFQSRHTLTFTKGAVALWRLLLREEHQMRARAQEEHRRTGTPARVEAGPLYRAVVEELQRMKDEEAAAASR